MPETFPVPIFRYIHEVYKILGQKNWFLTIFGLKTLHCKSRPVGKIKNPTPESDFSGRNTFQCQFSHLNIDFLKFYTDLSPISKMGACHTIQDGGINVGRVYCSVSLSVRQFRIVRYQWIFAESGWVLTRSGWIWLSPAESGWVWLNLAESWLSSG